MVTDQRAELDYGDDGAVERRADLAREVRDMRKDLDEVVRSLRELTQYMRGRVDFYGHAVIFMLILNIYGIPQLIKDLAATASGGEAMKALAAAATAAALLALNRFIGGPPPK